MKKAFLGLSLVLQWACQPKSSSQVHIAGAMRNIMMKGDLAPNIDLDTIQMQNDMYGIGPADSLKGELLIDHG